MRATEARRDPVPTAIRRRLQTLRNARQAELVPGRTTLGAMRRPVGVVTSRQERARGRKRCRTSSRALTSRQSARQRAPSRSQDGTLQVSLLRERHLVGPGANIGPHQGLLSAGRRRPRCRRAHPRLRSRPCRRVRRTEPRTTGSTHSAGGARRPPERSATLTAARIVSASRAIVGWGMLVA